MSNHDDEPVEYPAGTVYLEPEARALHEQVERIAAGERRAVAHGTLIGALSAAAVMTLAWVLGSDLGVVGAGTVAVSNVLSWAYLTATRPASVKAWEAGR